MMTDTNSNLRKAAVLLRSVDADTAATLLAQLSSAEAASLREAIRALGPLDPDEQADVLAEFRRVSPLAAEPAARGVELSLSSATFADAAETALPQATSNGKRFESLERAPVTTLASRLAREHAQTIAVVLSHLVPARAAAVLAALPEKLQAETIERLSNLGETDAEIVTVLEHELAGWDRKRVGDARNRTPNRETLASILAAADAKTRDDMLANLKAHKSALADQLGPARPERSQPRHQPRISENRTLASTRELRARHRGPERIPVLQPPLSSRPPLPRVDFDRLIHLDERSLTRLLRALDANVLALALAGSSDEMVDRICIQMPRRTAKAFRRQLRRLGPTRLSDVEAAQRAVAELAAQQLADRRPARAAARA